MQTFSHALQKKRKASMRWRQGGVRYFSVRFWYFSVLSVGCCASYIISRLPVNLKFYIIQTLYRLNLDVWAPRFGCHRGLGLCLFGLRGSFVYIVWLIACKEHNELLIQCAPSPTARVCTLNVIRDSASCPWWADLSGSYAHWAHSCTAPHCRRAGEVVSSKQFAVFLHADLWQIVYKEQLDGFYVLYTHHVWKYT